MGKQDVKNKEAPAAQQHGRGLARSALAIQLREEGDRFFPTKINSKVQRVQSSKF